MIEAIIMLTRNLSFDEELLVKIQSSDSKTYFALQNLCAQKVKQTVKHQKKKMLLQLHLVEEEIQRNDTIN
jgi:hypothetical protein